jgi:hypothetical protein
LVFHDLRRAFGSRLIETPGVHPALTRDWLGHANITTTLRYLTTSAAGLQKAAKKFELARGFAQSSHNGEKTDEAPAGELSPELAGLEGIEVVTLTFAQLEPYKGMSQTAGPCTSLLLSRTIHSGEA